MKFLLAVGTSISTVLIYLGLPLLGWGLSDLAAFFSRIYHLAFAMVIVAFGLAVGWQAIVAPEGIQGSRGDLTKLVRRQSFVGGALVAFLFGALFFLPFAEHRDILTMPAHTLVQWMGLVIGTVGVALIFWSGLALGKMYSAEVTLQKNHQLITTGLYRYIRHPRYLGNLCLFVGLSLLFRSWLGLAAAPLFFGILFARIIDEEALMLREFGAEWEAYRHRSWRFIPLLF